MKRKQGAPGFDDAEPNKLRRGLMIGGAALGGVVAAGLGVNEGAKALRRAGDAREARETAEEEARFDAEVEAEKLQIRPRVEEGIRLQARRQEIIAESRAVLARMSELVRQGKREEAFPLLEEADNIRRQVDTTNGNEIYGLFDEATPYAELLLRNELALSALATASLLFRKGSEERGDTSPEFPYWHNLTAGYIELAKLTKAQLREKFTHLFAYLDRETKNASSLRPEQLLYALLDERFDFTLTATRAAEALDRNTPTWRNFPATHDNRDGYAHYNDLSVLDIFELNKLVRVSEQMNTPAFRASVFSARDADIADNTSEHGGVIVRPEVGRELEVHPSLRQAGNEQYIVPTSTAMSGLTNPSQFHFHATTIETPAMYHGPSGGDGAFFSPSTVFSSVNADTVLAHFSVSREDWDENGPRHRQEVVSLGEIKKP